MVLLSLAACSSGDGGPAPGPVPTTTAVTATMEATVTTVAEVTVRGTVATVSASARVVGLARPVDGIANLALAADAEIVRAGGARASLADVVPGAAVEATGRPSTADTVIVRRLVLA